MKSFLHDAGRLLAGIIGSHGCVRRPYRVMCAIHAPGGAAEPRGWRGTSRRLRQQLSPAAPGGRNIKKPRSATRSGRRGVFGHRIGIGLRAADGRGPPPHQLPPSSNTDDRSGPCRTLKYWVRQGAYLGPRRGFSHIQSLPLPYLSTAEKSHSRDYSRSQINAIIVSTEIVTQFV